MAGFAEYDDYDGLGLAGLVEKGEVSAEELLDEAVTRTGRINPAINAVTHKHYDEARAVRETLVGRPDHDANDSGEQEHHPDRHDREDDRVGLLPAIEAEHHPIGQKGHGDRRESLIEGEGHAERAGGQKEH